jgi:hypothetical protein
MVLRSDTPLVKNMVQSVVGQGGKGEVAHIEFAGRADQDTWTSMMHAWASWFLKKLKGPEKGW